MTAYSLTHDAALAHTFGVARAIDYYRPLIQARCPGSRVDVVHHPISGPILVAILVDGSWVTSHPDKVSRPALCIEIADA